MTVESAVAGQPKTSPIQNVPLNVPVAPPRVIFSNQSKLRAAACSKSKGKGKARQRRAGRPLF